jgi:hypothetical protein
MQQNTKRRLAILERSIELPLTFKRFMARVDEHARLTGAGSEEALDALASSLSAETLNRLAEECLDEEFRGDIEARNEWIREEKMRIQRELL